MKKLKIGRKERAGLNIDAHTGQVSMFEQEGFMPESSDKQFGQQICKFQRPIVTNSNSGDTEVLVYNEDRSLMGQIPVDKKTFNELFPDNEFKTYWLCELNKESKMLEPLEQVEEQEW